LFVNDKTGVITMAMDPSNPDVLYASTWQVYRRPWTLNSGGPGSGIYKSTDGGAHWTNITHNQGLPTGIWGKAGIAVAPSNPNVVYALIQAKYKKGHPGGLFRSDDGGQTWKLVNDSTGITQRAFYYMRVYVDPTDANTIYLPNVDVFVSHDGGKKLKKLHPPHGDNHAFWINPNNPKVLIEGNDGGASVSQNGGKNWSTEHNQPTAQYYHADLDGQFPFHIYGAQQDEGSFESPSAVRAGGIPGVWQRVVGGEETWVPMQPEKPWINYGEGYYGIVQKENRRSHITTDVSPWPAYKYGLKMAKVKYRYGWWHTPLVTVPGHNDVLFAGANKLLKTTDAGIHWKAISPDLTRNDKSKQQRSGGPISADMTGEENFDTISTIGVSPLDPQIIWTGSDDGLVYVTQDGGGQWQQVRPPKLPKWSTITAVDPSPTAKGTAYVSASRYEWEDFQPYVYKTTDYGKHWTQITNGLPSDQYVLSVRQDPSDQNLLFVATSSTVYMSLDDGDQWKPLTLNLPTVRVTDVAIQPKQHAVVISTFGRGYWVLDNLQFLEQLGTAKVANDTPYLFKPQQTWLVKRRMGGFFTHSRTDNNGQNLRPGLTVFFHLPTNYSAQDPVKLSFTDENGKVIRSFNLPVKPEKKRGLAQKSENPKKLHSGMNRFQWNLRYPNAVDVNGIFHTSDGPHVPVGPEVLPGTYYAVLSYGGNKQRKTFTVKLDPRLHTTSAELQHRFDLLMQLRKSMSQLDTALNHAIAARDSVKESLGDNSGSASGGHQVLDRLNKDIDGLVDLRIQSNEGAVVYPTRLHSWMTQISSRIGQAFVAPTPSKVEIAKMYMHQASEAVTRLDADVAAANAALGKPAGSTSGGAIQ
jgi:photosystem II stability/assembly factor-like uncharacterized protein